MAHPKDTPGYEGEINRAKELKKEHADRGISFSQARVMARIEMNPESNDDARFIGWDARNYPMFNNKFGSSVALRSGGIDLPDAPFDLLPEVRQEGLVI